MRAFPSKTGREKSGDRPKSRGQAQHQKRHLCVPLPHQLAEPVTSHQAKGKSRRTNFVHACRYSQSNKTIEFQTVRAIVWRLCMGHISSKTQGCTFACIITCIMYVIMYVHNKNFRIPQSSSSPRKLKLRTILYVRGATAKRSMHFPTSASGTNSKRDLALPVT